MAHTYTWTYVDDDTHKGVCACGAETTEAHYDRWASTCGRQPHCEKCDHDYGSIPEHEMWYEDRGESGHKPSCYHCDTYFFLEPHTYGDWQDNGDGTHSRICAPCGRTETEAHSGGTATCVKGPICEKCSAEYGTRLGHIWGDWTDAGDGANHTRTCSNGCGETETAAHRDGMATCTEKAVCAVCGKEYGDLLDHYWGKWEELEYVNGSAYTDPLYHHRYCIQCGADQKEAHYVGGYDANTASGNHRLICGVCSFKYGTEPHTFGDWQDNGDGTHSRSCICGETQTEGHVGGTATCTEKAKCEACGVEYGNPLDHDLIDHAAQAPSCTEIGWDAYKTCSRCDYTTYVEKKALGHDLIDHEAKAPSCTEIGWEAYQTCSRCDYTTYAEKKALGHTEVIDPAVPATYTSTGLTEGKHCSVCNQVLVAQEVAPRLVAPAWVHAHTPVTDAAVAATCTRPGLTAGNHCGACGEVLTKQRRISALGHDYGVWTPAMTGAHSAICRRCGESSAVGCALVELDGARVCPVCGYAECEARATVIAPASATGDVPGGSLVIVKAETEKGKWLLMGFERGGRLLDIRGQIRFSVPAEALDGAALPGMEISGGKARFALNMEQETEVILVELGK
ncbi:MAG: hypothetical protein IJ664_00990 [Clostridia bacterium]|nr:hypothetical protein [Clostridia bacterium]